MKKNKLLFDQLITLNTERRNTRSMKIDSLSVGDILKLINSEDGKIAGVVGKEIPYIVQATELVLETFKRGGRLIYIGAGTSGRLGILDACECPPTYGTNHKMVQGIIAGGKKAVFKSQEGAEDKENEGITDVQKVGVNRKDVVCGIAASARTPYVISAIREAKRRGAKTIYITTNPRKILKGKGYKLLRKNIDVAICPNVGPEVIMGSTRMKSGTAQKLILNMITTTAMIRLGKVYENMMVDLKMNSNKLAERAKRVLMFVTGVDYNKASYVLEKSGGKVKTAIVMIKVNISAKEARKRLRKTNGFVRKAIDGL